MVNTAGQSPVRAALSGKCPACGEGKLFKSYLETSEACDHCGLDLTFADTADGPAVFVIFIVGALVVAAAIIVEFLFYPPYWVHLVLWVPAILILSLGMLRPLKGLMVGIQYAKQARPARLAEGD